MPEPDAVVIGAGPAGSTAAILLARAAKHVVLLEKETAAHDKVCGEFISSAAAARICDLGVDLESLGARKISCVRLVDGRNVLESVLPAPAYSLSRRALDEALMGKAAIAGAEIRRGANVTGLDCDAHWSVQTGNDVIRTDTVFLASGKHDVRGWPRRRGTGDDFIGFKMHFVLDESQRQALGDAVEMIFLDEGYAGLEPVEQGKTNLCFVVRKKGYAACGRDWQTLFRWLMKQSSHLAARLRDAEPRWPKPLAIYGIPYGYHYSSSRSERGLYRVGDQLAVIPSFAGEGLSIAVHSAFAAANDFLNGADNYYKDMTSVLRTPLRLAGLGGQLLSVPAGRVAAFSVWDIAPALLPRAIAATRLKR